VRGFRRLSFLNVLGNISLLLGLAAIFYDGFTRGRYHDGVWAVEGRGAGKREVGA
jgi:hypothetical protein